MSPAGRIHLHSRRGYVLVTMVLSMRRGFATVEFAVIAPLMLLLLAGVLDFAVLVRRAMNVADAARAGAQYGSLSTVNSLDSAGMQTAALNAAPDVPGITATATRTCQCPSGTTVSCSTSCSGKLLIYVQVTAQATCNAVFAYPSLPFNGSFGTTATMRVQ